MYKMFTHQELKVLRQDFARAQNLTKQSPSLIGWDEYLQRMYQVKSTNPEAFQSLMEETLDQAG